MHKSVRFPAGDGIRKLVIRDSGDRKISVKEVAASTTHSIANLIPGGAVELWENNALKFREKVGKKPEDIDFRPPPPPPPPSYVPEKVEKPKRGLVARFLNK